MAKGYAYIRLSSKEQLGVGKDGFDRQINSIRLIAQRYGVEIEPQNIYEDKGVSGYSGRNSQSGQLKELIDDIENLDVQKGDYLFVESIDRLSRQRLLQTKDLVYEKILKKGLILITTSDGAKYELKDDPTEDFKQDLLLSVIAQRAHEESQIKSLRRKSAWKRAKDLAVEKKEIFNSHNPPFGISFNKELNCFEVNDVEAAEIRKIFNLLLDYGIKETVTRMNKSNSIREWRNNNIVSMIKTKYVIGCLQSQIRNKGRKQFTQYIENYYPQIISNTLFSQVKSAMANRKLSSRQGMRTKGNLNIFRHCVKCEHCGETMIFAKQYNHQKQVYFYYQCNGNREIKGSCPQLRFRFDYLFAAFVSLIKYTVNIVQDIEEIKKFDFVEIVDEKKQVDNYEKVKEFFINLTSRAAKSEFNISLAELTENLNKKEELLDSFNRKIRQASESGIDISDLPLEFLVNAKKVHVEVDSLKSEIDQLKIKMNEEGSELKINSHKEIIELFKTESGRTKINNYLVSNNLILKIKYEKKGRTLEIFLYKNGIYQDISYKIEFKLHKPLFNHFGFDSVFDIVEEKEIFEVGPNSQIEK